VGCSWQGEGLALLGADLAAMLDERAELAPVAKQYELLDKACKEAVKAALPDGGEGVAGGWGVNVKLIKSTKWDAPKEHKAAHPEFNKTQVSARVTFKGEENE
jgi:hypothetical protein